MSTTAYRRSERTYAEGQVLTTDDIFDVLEGFQVQPEGVFEWQIEYNEEDHTLEISSFSHDSRSHDFDDEYAPDPMAKATQTVIMPMPNPVTETSLVRMAYQGLALKAAHEVMEWTRYQGEMLYDPHVDDEPTVILPPISVRMA